MTSIHRSKQQHHGVLEQHDHPLIIPLMNREMPLAPSAFVALSKAPTCSCRC